MHINIRSNLIFDILVIQKNKPTVKTVTKPTILQNKSIRKESEDSEEDLGIKDTKFK